jgi:hypothetical protein
MPDALSFYTRIELEQCWRRRWWGIAEIDAVAVEIAPET